MVCIFYLATRQINKLSADNLSSSMVSFKVNMMTNNEKMYLSIICIIFIQESMQC